MKLFQVTFPREPHRNRRCFVRGICKIDVLNPCWDGRKNDVAGKHWGGGKACAACTEAALDAAKSQEG